MEMYRTIIVRRIAGFVLAAGLTAATAFAQGRGLYTGGFYSTMAGTMPDPGFSYANYFYFDTSDRLKGPNGGPIKVDGNLGIMVDNNVIVYVTKYKFLGANIGFSGDPVVANGNLSTQITALNIPLQGGGGGFGPLWISPLTLGWHTKRVDVQAGYSFFAPTGRFSPGAKNNIGVGYWSNDLMAGATVYLTANKGTQLSVNNFYGFQTQQEGTGVTPGQYYDIDYSLTQMLPLNKKMTWLFMVGPAGYGQWQTTKASGNNPPILNNLKYGVNGIGFVANLVSPTKKVILGSNWYWEYGASNTREGMALYISASLQLSSEPK